jgi:hypothetical protein
VGGALGVSENVGDESAARGTPRVTPTVPDLLVAFIGDQGSGDDADAVLRLIRDEGAHATVHNGDFDYESNPAAFDGRINTILGDSYPYFAVIGNHDAPRWDGPGGYGELVAARVARVPDMKCTGQIGVQASCSFRGLHLIESCVGTSEYTGASCAKNSAEQTSFLRRSLDTTDAIWSVCAWHKNQRDMSVGMIGNDVGWNAYTECMRGGAIVTTGHHHSYSRTLTLTDIGNASDGHGAIGAFDHMELSKGRTFALVSGLGGHSVRAFDPKIHGDDTWWASYFTSDRWMMNGVEQTGVGTHGALFVRFHVDGDGRKALAYFKDVAGRIADTFTISVK